MTDPGSLAQGIAQRRPEFAAQVLETLGSTDARALLAELPSATAASVLACMLPRHAAACINGMEPALASPTIARLSPAVAASFLRLLNDAELRGLLAILPEHRALPLRFLLRYSSAMIGAWMEAGGFLLPVEASVGEARERARLDDGDLDRMVFVVDRRQKLRGAVPAAALLREDPGRALSELLQPVPFFLRGRAELRAAIDHPGWKNWDPLPVVDRERRVVGLLHYSGLRSGLENGLSSVDKTPHVDASLGELLDLSWQGLADLLEGSLRLAPGLVGRRRSAGSRDD